MRKLAVALCLALFATTACWPFDDEAALTEMTLELQRGVMSVVRGGEVTAVLDAVSDRVAVKPGDVIRGGRGSRGELRLEGARFLQVAGFDSRLDLSIVTPDEVDGRSGNVLANAKAPTTVMFGDVEATASDARFRVDRGIASTRAAAYDGEVQLRAPGESTLVVGRLRQAAVAADDLPARADLYSLDTEDYWDKLFLGNLVSLQEDILQLAGGFQNQLGKTRPGVAYFEALADGKDASFIRPYLKRASAVDLLIAFNVALRVEDMSLHKAFRRTFRLFERGASWGVVADIMGVSPRVLVASLERVIKGATRGRAVSEPELTVAAAEEASSPSGGSSGDPTPSGGGDGGGSGTGSGGGGGGGGGGDEPPDKPKDEPEECDPNDFQCEIEEILPDALSSPSP